MLSFAPVFGFCYRNVTRDVTRRERHAAGMAPLPSPEKSRPSWIKKLFRLAARDNIAKLSRIFLNANNWLTVFRRQKANLK